MVKGPQRKTEESVPASFAETPPPASGLEVSTWLLNSNAKLLENYGKMESTLIGVQAQLGRIESKLDLVNGEVTGHGKWIHTLKIFAGVIGAILVWLITYALWPWLKAKIFGGGTP